MIIQLVIFLSLIYRWFKELDVRTEIWVSVVLVSYKLRIMLKKKKDYPPTAVTGVKCYLILGTLPTYIIDK